MKPEVAALPGASRGVTAREAAAPSPGGTAFFAFFAPD